MNVVVIGVAVPQCKFDCLSCGVSTYQGPVILVDFLLQQRAELDDFYSPFQCYDDVMPCDRGAMIRTREHLLKSTALSTLTRGRESHCSISIRAHLLRRSKLVTQTLFEAVSKRGEISSGVI